MQQEQVVWVRVYVCVYYFVVCACVCVVCINKLDNYWTIQEEQVLTELVMYIIGIQFLLMLLS